MGRAKQRKLLRKPRFEPIEERLAFSADGLGDFQYEQVAPPLEHHTENASPQLNDAHGRTGVANVVANYGLSGVGQTVAIIDSGIAYDHYALGRGYGTGYKVVGGWDFAENDANPFDDAPGGFHGTHVAGIVSSTNSTYRGVAYGTDLVALRVFTDSGAGYFSWIENALRWVHTHRNDYRFPITTVNLSLGTSWNAETVPNWSTIEDELALLKSDGIFIAVSAGNSFAEYGTRGLSYPAASPYVVPVASVDDNGNLSSFSQRTSRVIAAPGASITSTVPDYVFGADGTPNDYGTASGTSMASPYVAGSAALIRQAMQFVGYATINEDTIYNHMRATADIIYDTVTASNYYRLNMQRAIDALMPADDYGSTVATAFSLGNVGDTGLTRTGIVGRISDRDYFTFTAAATGTARLSATADYEMVAGWQKEGSAATISGNAMSFQVIAGQSYTVSLGTSAGIGRYSIAYRVEPSITDWGTISYARHDNLNLTSSETWYRVTAGRSGILSVDSSFLNADGNVDLELYDGSGVLVGTSAGTGDRERIDIVATAGTAYQLRVRGMNRDVDVVLGNLLVQSGGQLDVYGTAGDDSFSFTTGSQHTIVVNGLQYAFQASGISAINFLAGEGADTISLTGSTGHDTAHLRVGSTRLVNSLFSLIADNCETVTVTGSGSDVAVLYDSSGDDTLVSTPTSTTLSGTGFTHTAKGFSRIEAYASLGTDRASLFDSSGADRYYADPLYSILNGQGFYIYAQRFDYVDAYSTAGGDYALMYDSIGDDVFQAAPGESFLRGAGFRNVAHGFRRVEGYSTMGGRDAGVFYDSAGADSLTATPSWASLTGSNFAFRAWGFAQIEAYASRGYDVAFLYDSSGSDRFYSTPDYSILNGSGFYNYAQGFDRVDAYSSAGQADYAYLYGSLGDDDLVSSIDYCELATAAASNRATGFESLQIFGNGGADDAIFLEVGEQDLLYGRSNYVRLSKTAAATWAYDFSSVTARSNSDGWAFSDVQSVDYLFAREGQWT